jgi:ABC-type Zn uptake system ZnuABC Zn-binding protein ZnuA
MRVQKLNKSKKLALIPFLLLITISLTALLCLNACNADNELNNKTKENQTEQGNKSSQKPLPKVLAVESFLADITKNVSGTRLEIDTLMPLGLDPHSFEPSPGDVAKIAESDILITNGAGLEEWLEDIITGANEKIIIVECSKSLKNRKGDPHFWLDPNLVKVYVHNIRDALIESDPQGKDLYNKNAEEYTARLIELDKWISEAVKKIPEDKRLLVTNHESFGYYADRYGFKVIGTIIPGSSSASSPSAKEISELIEKIKATGAKAIFLETGSDPKIANQIARETNIKIVTELYTHSITEPDGPAPTYIDMIEFNTNEIVESLK